MTRILFGLILLWASSGEAQVITTPSTAGNGVPFTVTVSGGPAHPLDWVGLFDSAATPDQGNYLQWQFLNGSHTPPSVGLSSASVQFTASSGTYNLRWFTGGGYTRIAASGSITVAGAAPASTTLLINGDSNTSYDYVSASEHWADQVAAGLGLSLVNMAVSGKYSDGVLMDVPAMAALAPQVCMIQIGGNDMAASISNDASSTAARTRYLENMRQIITGLKPFCRSVVILSPPFMGHRRETGRYPSWTEGLHALTSELGVAFIDLYRHMQALSDTLSQAHFDAWYRMPSLDPYHLSPTGHAVVSALVLRYGRW